MNGRIGLQACWLAFLLPACGPGDSRPANEDASVSGFSQMDSAGVVVSVTSGVSALSPLPWEVDSVPEVTIGAVDDPVQGLYRVQGVRSLSHGGTVVVDGGSKELRFFDARGQLDHRVGREGEGPGEFLDPVLVPTPLSDSLLVWDRALLRFQLFSEEGRNPRTISLKAKWPAGGLPPVGGLGTRMLLRDPQTWNTEAQQYGPRHTEVDFVWFDLATEKETSVLSSSFTPVYAQRLPGLTAPGIHPIPFSSDPSGIVSPAGALITEGKGHEIREYDFEGRLARVFRVDAPRRPVSQEHIAELINREVDKHPGARGFLEEVYAEMPIPDSLPVFESLRLDEVGWVWAELYQVDQAKPVSWVLFDPVGRGRGTVKTPRGLRVHEIGEDFVLGVWVDDLGVEYVRRHRLRRGSGFR